MPQIAEIQTRGDEVWVRVGSVSADGASFESGCAVWTPAEQKRVVDNAESTERMRVLALITEYREDVTNTATSAREVLRGLYEAVRNGRWPTEKP